MYICDEKKGDWLQNGRCIFVTEKKAIGYRMAIALEMTDLDMGSAADWGCLPQGCGGQASPRSGLRPLLGFVGPWI